MLFNWFSLGCATVVATGMVWQAVELRSALFHAPFITKNRLLSQPHINNITFVGQKLCCFHVTFDNRKRYDTCIMKNNRSFQ